MKNIEIANRRQNIKAIINLEDKLHDFLYSFFNENDEINIDLLNELDPILKNDLRHDLFSLNIEIFIII